MSSINRKLMSLADPISTPRLAADVLAIIDL